MEPQLKLGFRHIQELSLILSRVLSLLFWKNSHTESVLNSLDIS